MSGTESEMERWRTGRWTDRQDDGRTGPQIYTLARKKHTARNGQTQAQKGKMTSNFRF